MPVVGLVLWMWLAWCWCDVVCLRCAVLVVCGVVGVGQQRVVGKQRGYVDNSWDVVEKPSKSKVVPRGLEPRTLRLLAVRSNQLSYETDAPSDSANFPLEGRTRHQGHGTRTTPAGTPQHPSRQKLPPATWEVAARRRGEN